MPLKYGPLGMQPDDRYRIVPETRMVEMLALLGWPYESGSPAAAEGAKEALQAWIQIGLSFRRAANGERLFDPIEVYNFMKRAGFDGHDGFWLDRFVATQRRMYLDMAGAKSSGVRTEKERRFVVDFRRTFHLRPVAAESKLRLRAPLPLSGDYFQDLQVTPYAETARPSQINVSPGRMEVRMVASGEAEAVLGAKLSFTARLQEPSPGQAGGCPESTLYLCEREGLIVVSERIRALAQSLAGNDTPPLEAARAFWEYINGKLMSGMLHYDQIDLTSPCDWVLDSGWFDCQLGSSLFVALCRARGIPARLVGGYLLYQAAPTNHFWAEVWIEDQGWTPFDFLSWDLSQGGRDLEWRDRYFGRLNHRLTCERLPREFTGSLGVPIPPAWCLFQVPKPGGVEISFLDLSNGAPVYADTLCVSPIA